MPEQEGKAPARKPATAKSSTSAASGQSLDLATLFGAAAQALAANQGTLNQADTKSGNHGDHIVQTFALITEAVTATKGKPPADQLAYASKALAGHAKVSGSAKVYADGLAKAAEQYAGQKTITPEMATGLVQTLLAGGAASGNQKAATGADLFGQLLGAASGQPVQSDPNKLDMGDLLNAGMSFLQAKQSGQDNMQAALGALMSASPLSQEPHRQQSGELIASTLLQAISAFSKK